MNEENSNFEIILPDGTIYRGEKSKETAHTIHGFNSEGKAKKMKFLSRNECERCGECCRRDTPILLKEDIPLLREGIITEKDMYTIRDGERVRSSIDGEIYYSSMEMIKIKPIFGSFTCLFYDPHEGCTIYEKRPTVCKQFECWSQNVDITGLYKRSLTRSDLFDSIDILKKAIHRHEEYCSMEKFNELIDKLRKGEAENTEKIAEMIIYDLSIRDWLKDRLSLNDEIMPLLLGRSLFELAPTHGLLIEKQEENFIIKVIEEEEE